MVTANGGLPRWRALADSPAVLMSDEEARACWGGGRARVDERCCVRARPGDSTRWAGRSGHLRTQKTARRRARGGGRLHGWSVVGQRLFPRCQRPTSASRLWPRHSAFVYSVLRGSTHSTKSLPAATHRQASKIPSGALLPPLQYCPSILTRHHHSHSLYSLSSQRSSADAILRRPPAAEPPATYPQPDQVARAPAPQSCPHRLLARETPP